MRCDCELPSLCLYLAIAETEFQEFGFASTLFLSCSRGIIFQLLSFIYQVECIKLAFDDILDRNCFTGIDSASTQDLGECGLWVLCRCDVHCTVYTIPTNCADSLNHHWNQVSGEWMPMKAFWKNREKNLLKWIWNILLLTFNSPWGNCICFMFISILIFQSHFSWVILRGNNLFSQRVISFTRMYSSQACSQAAVISIENDTKLR